MPLIALLLAGCGSATTHHTAARPAIDGCVPLTAGARSVELRPPGAQPIQGVLLGTATTTFVLSDESDENLCSWLSFVTRVRAHHYAALLYDYTDPTELAADARAGASAALAAGARRVVLMGASVGARASIEAAARRQPWVIAVVSLSAERTVRSDPTDLVTHAREVRTPTLLVSARDDPFVTGATIPILKALASPRKRALIVPGLDHGTALLTGNSRDRVQDAILQFLAPYR